MAADFQSIFAALKPMLGRHASRLAVQTDTPTEYSLVTKGPSPFRQHKGQPMWFGAVKVGKAYVSYHLMPIYMHPGLQKAVTPALQKHMQGKSCFNFKEAPGRAVLQDLEHLTKASVEAWSEKKWV